MWLLLLSLALDYIDGPCARAFDMCTQFGAARSAAPSAATPAAQPLALPPPATYVPRLLLQILLLPTLSCIGHLALSSSRSASPSPAPLPRPLWQATCSTTIQTTYRCSGWSAPLSPPPPSPLLVNPECLITYSLGLHHLHLHHQRRRQRSPRCRRLRLHGQAHTLPLATRLRLGAGTAASNSRQPFPGSRCGHYFKHSSGGNYVTRLVEAPAPSSNSNSSRSSRNRSKGGTPPALHTPGGKPLFTHTPPQP